MITPHPRPAVSLEARRLNAGHSVSSLAAAAGVGPKTVYRLEEGRRVNPQAAKKIADVLGCLVTDLMPPRRTDV